MDIGDKGFDRADIAAHSRPVSPQRLHMGTGPESATYRGPLADEHGIFIELRRRCIESGWRDVDVDMRNLNVDRCNFVLRVRNSLTQSNCTPCSGPTSDCASPTR